MRTCILALLVVTGFTGLIVPAASAQVEGLRPYPGPLPGAEPDGVSIMLVRDRRTGAPIAGVTVKRYLEIIDPRAAVAPFAGEGRTDAFGLVCMPVKEGSPDSHWIFEKPGHAVAEEYGILCDETVELRPGRELHGQVFDARGRPAPGVAVELFLGCGHSPTVRRVKTDAAGRFTMRDVTPYFGTLWIPAPHLAAHNVVGPAGTAKHRPLEVHASPGMVLTGVVVNKAGKPLEGVVVRSAQETRGPTATTGPDGRFALEGYDPDHGLRLLGTDQREVWIGRGSFDLDQPARFVYPASDEEEPDAAPPEDPTTTPLGATLVVSTTGFPEGRDAILELVLARRAAALPRHGEEATHLPAKASAVVRAEADGLVRHFPVGPVVDGKRHATVKWPAMKRVETAFGRRFKLSLRHAESRDTGEGVLQTHGAGPALLVVHDRVLGEQEIPISIPDQPGAVVRVAADALRAPGELSVTRPDGTPLAGESLHLDGEHFSLDERGRLVSWQVKGGAAIRVAREGFVSLRRTLTGHGPFELSWGTARLDLEVPGLTGFTAYVDGDLFDAKGSRLTVRGLDAGTHTVIVAAEGHESRVFRVTLGKAETRAVSVALPVQP